MTSIILLVLIASILFFIGYNFFSMRKGQISAKNAMDELDTQLKNRLKLAPEIYTFVKQSGYSEKDMLVNLKKSGMLSKRAKTIKQLSEASRYMDRVMERLNLIAIQNSELRLNREFIEICSKIIVLDEKIAFSKKFYYDSVTKYNGLIVKSPNKIVANIFNFKIINPG